MTLAEFIPVNQQLAGQIGLVRAAVAGAVFHFSKMRDGVCRKSAGNIGAAIGLERTTVHNALKWLVSESWIIDTTPTINNAPHHYQPTVDLINVMEKQTVDDINSNEQTVDLINSNQAETVDDINSDEQTVDLITQEEYLTAQQQQLPQGAGARDETYSPALRALTTNYQDFISSTINPILADEFREFADLEPAWINKAYQIAGKQDALNWPFVRAILTDCKRAGRWVDKPKPKQTPKRGNYANNGSSSGKSHRRAVPITAAEAREEIANL